MSNEPQTNASASAEPPAPWTRLALVGGFVAFSLGAWLLLDAIGVPRPSLARHWPIFIALGGLASFGDYQLISRRAGALGLAVTGIGFGILFYTLTLGIFSVAAIDDWGPILPLVVGLTFLATWWASEVRSNAHLTVGASGIGIALLFWSWQLVRLEVFWALGLLAVGGFFVWMAMSQRRKS